MHSRPLARALAVPLLFAICVAAVALLPAPARAEERMRRFEAVYDIQPDGSIHVTETITWDFGPDPRHGIFRNLVTKQACAGIDREGGDPRTYDCPVGSDRHYGIAVESITDAAGNAYKYDRSNAGDGIQLKIGDPDTTITGEHVYRITYKLTGALDAYASHGELYWNASGTWPVTVDATVVTVKLPTNAAITAVCFQGYRSTASCKTADGAGSVTYTATRFLAPNEQLSIVAMFPRDAVTIPAPIVKDRPSIDDYFEFDLVEIAESAVLAALGVFGIIAVWWRLGRDRRFTTVHYLTNDPTQETRPLFAKDDVVVEYLPPDELRPAQMGVLLDERADTLDVTATIVDMAVRGYLHITEIPKKGHFGNRDWQFEKLKEPEGLQPYEAALFGALFKGKRTEVKISSLKTKFAQDLKKVKDELYRDAVNRRWFDRNPETQRWRGAVPGIVLAIAGVALSVGSAFAFGRGFIGVPFVVLGVLFAVLGARTMARRTAVGSEARRRVLGFRLYVDTAETRQQEFNEQRNIFARYLPYAMVFGCVEKWAKAFEGIEDQAAEATSGWYAGTAPFQAMAFSQGMQSFSSSVGSAISSTPASSGSGGGGGGFSGGGGGGGGGGSW
ncbi:MAG: DUF2207 domain-containing protein [Dehalococcoidia bacterium]|nr:DUF2207 domain-containing protein [Dehalococcoidia bacterium]